MDKRKQVEIWNDIKEYEGYYQVSNLGRVKSLKRSYEVERHKSKYLYNKKEKILSQTTTKLGYKRISLNKHNKLKSFLVHRLVAKAFIEEIKDKNQVNHKNCNKLDNNLFNLEWVNQSENMKHAYKNGFNHTQNLKGDNHNNKKLNFEEIKEIRRLYKKENTTYLKLSNKFNTCMSNIGRIIRRERWDYNNEEEMNEYKR